MYAENLNGSRIPVRVILDNGSEIYLLSNRITQFLYFSMKILDAKKFLTKCHSKPI